MNRKVEARRFTGAVRDVRSRQPIEEGDLSGYVRNITLVLLFDLREDVELTAGYLMPLWDLCSNYRVSLDHAALAQQIDQSYGTPVGTQYRQAVSRWREHRKEVAGRNRPH